MTQAMRLVADEMRSVCAGSASMPVVSDIHRAIVDEASSPAPPPCRYEFLRLMSCLQTHSHAAVCAHRYADLVGCLRRLGLE